MEKKSEIAEFYSGKTIFVTGFSGFIGKVLVWKLLYSCPKLSKIYVLLRPKWNKSITQRLDELLQTIIFDNFRQSNPKMLEKISAITGDVSLPNLGISAEDEQKLFNEVNVVYHVAAILKLDANLKSAININVTGTFTLLNMAKNMSKLMCFVYTSTAYCHCDVQIMEEKLYPARHNPYDIMELIRWMDLETLNSITESLLKPHPNSYTYSKRLAENVVSTFYPELPVVIARPSIVIPAWFEPIPGWVDNMNGPVGLLIGGGKGVVRTMYFHENLECDMIPVDMVCNGLIAIPAKISLNTSKPKELPVFNLAKQGSDPLKWSEILDVGERIMSEYPFETVLWNPNRRTFSNFYIHFIMSIFHHWIPAYCVDFLLFLIGRKPFLVKVQKKVYHGQKVLSYFGTRTWLFDKKNLTDLSSWLSPEDRKIFKVTTEGFEVYPYMLTTNKLIQQFLLKEDPRSMPKRRIRRKIFYVIEQAVQILFVCFVAWMILKMFGLNDYLYKP